MSQEVVSLQPKNKKSPLAIVLTRLLDDTGLFSRDQWAEFLSVTPAAISQWVNDKTVPRPEVLQSILDTLKRSAGIPPGPLDDFEQIARRPAKEISPRAESIGPTLQHYLLKPLVEGFFRNLEVLPSEEQTKVLYKAIQHCRQLYRNRPQPEAVSKFNSTPGKGECESLNTLTGVQVIRGHEIASLFRKRPHLKVVGASAAPPSKMYSPFDPSTLHEDGGINLPSCEAAVWQFSTSENFDSLPVDEMMLFLLNGQASLTFSGGQHPTVLSPNKDDARLLWMTAIKKGQGLPPFRLEVPRNKEALFLAVFYAQKGVRFQRSADTQVKFETERWSDENILKFWQSVGERGQRLPLAGPVPSDRNGLAQFIEKHKPLNLLRHNVHDPARKAGQILDADFPWWIPGRKAVLSPMLLKLPTGHSFNDGDVEVAHHTGKEFFIALRGSLKFACAELEPADGETTDLQFSHFINNYEPEQRCVGVIRGPQKVSEYPDILLVSSSYAHGFLGEGNEDAYCLHIRCMSDPRGLSRQGQRQLEHSEVGSGTKGRRQ